MTKRFHFDDEDEDFEEQGYKQLSRINENKEDTFSSREKEYEFVQNRYIKDTDDVEIEVLHKEENKEMSKKKKMKFQKWHYILIGVLICMMGMGIYIFELSSNDGPVYGKRCEGLETISADLLKASENDAKSKYSSILDISMKLGCRQLKIDIVFKDDTSTKEAISIAEDSALILDKMVGKPVKEGNTYSELFGTINNKTQYEINLYLKCEDNEDFPIYGTKNVQNDYFSYTYSSIKDQESYDKAKDTLNEKE